MGNMQQALLLSRTLSWMYIVRVQRTWIKQKKQDNPQQNKLKNTKVPHESRMYMNGVVA